MGVGKGLGSVKRFGPRYGRTVKHKLAKLESEQKKPQVCPYCRRPKAKRLSAGIYHCQKCDTKFTGRAYFLAPLVKSQSKAETVSVFEEASAEQEEE